MLTFLVLCVIILHFTPLRHLVRNVQDVKAVIKGTGAWAPLVFIGSSMILIGLGTPRLIFCSLGGLLFGFVEGLAFSHLASLAGSYATYLFARWGGGEWLKKKMSGRPTISQFISESSIVKIFIARQLPVAGVLMNVLLGMARAPHAQFLIGSFLGFLPAGIVATLIGSGFGKESAYQSLIQIFSAATLLFISALIVIKVRKKYFRQDKDEIPS